LGGNTWPKGDAYQQGGGSIWVTGTYDPEQNLLFFGTGNPGPDYFSGRREGDNLFTASLVAVDLDTGKLKWHYQFTPHDLWDWDATQTSVLVDHEWEGAPRKLMLHADRNGFFYVFDRRDGSLLLAKRFVENLTWASGIGADGRPQKLPHQEPSASGTKVCPSQDGATNWYSPSFNPTTGLYYVQTFEKCSLYFKSDQGPWEKGREYLGGTQRTLPDPKPRRILRAIDIRTGTIAWELAQPGPAISWGGTLTTATGLVFVAEEGGALMAVDAKSGEPLWSFETNQTWRASPMTYMFDGRQYIAIASGPNIVAFSVADSSKILR
jgi:alcohol dehydrogenase (cytochrome c)